MDLIYTNAEKIDQGVLAAYTLDLSFGAEENDFELTLSKDESGLEYGAYVYIENSEYGGIIDGKGSISSSSTVTYYGRTWHGVLNSKIIQPPVGEDYFIIYSNDAHWALSQIIKDIGLSDLFTVCEDLTYIPISGYQFKRYCKAYDGIRDMLASVGAKLKITWKDRKACLSVEPISDYSEHEVDNDAATLSVEHFEKKVNRLICLGRGELAAREVVYLCVNRAGGINVIDNIGEIDEARYYTGLEEIAETYDYNNAESYNDLVDSGITKLLELRDSDRAEISVAESNLRTYDIGDRISALDRESDVTATASVIQKIIKIQNGTVHIEYKTGG